jgi:TPP-dependent pyruvate/acetoin dehydrogenase alpha subunit
MGAWRARDPVVRFRNWLVHNDWWDQAREQELRQKTRQQASVHMHSWVALHAPPCIASSIRHRRGYSSKQVECIALSPNYACPTKDPA